MNSYRSGALRVVLVAEEAAGVQALRAIVAAGVVPVAVLTGAPLAASQRGVSVAGLAQKLGCAVWPGDRVRTAALAQRLRDEGVDLLINVHSLHPIHAQVIEAPTLGSYNLHPGPLPEFAGLNAPSWAIYLGQTRHAVTLHRMAPRIDAGPIAYETWFDLDQRATGLSVSTRCVRLGIPLVERLLTAAQRGAAAIPAKPQDQRQRRCFRKRDRPHDGRVPWQASAAELARWIRASDFHPLPSPWGYPVTQLGPLEVRLAKAEAAPPLPAADPGCIVGVDERGVVVATGDGSLILRMVVAGGKRMAARDLLRPGMRLR
ncbi:MAG: methionyl-tRNA formyltransferase [Pseudomonadales bacterium]